MHLDRIQWRVNDVRSAFFIKTSLQPGVMRVKADSLYDRLRSFDAERDAAISELRTTLLRGLSRSLNNRYGKGFSAEDIIQEALIRILASLDQFQGQSQFITWALTIANRVGIAALRRSYHRDRSFEAFDQNSGYQIEIPMIQIQEQQHPERQEVLLVLQRLIDTVLTEKQRFAVRAFLDEYSTDDIATQLGTNRNAVYKLIHDARSRLKMGLEKAGISQEDIQTLFS